MKKKRGFLNMYLTSTVSVSLVLYLVGLLASMVLASKRITTQVKENMGFSIVLLDSADQNEIKRLEEVLLVAPFTKSVSYVSKEEALKEHISSLGEDPTSFLGYNPLLASFEVKLKADYAVTDSIESIEAKVKAFPSVKRVIYHKDVLDLVDDNIATVSWFFVAVALILLVISVVLINNTIRLSVYSKRFLINTMKLVGATGWMIKRPFVRKHVVVGIFASLIALLLLGATFYYFWYSTTILLLGNDWIPYAVLSGIVLVVGLLISFIASYFAVGRYIRMRTDDLYYI